MTESAKLGAWGERRAARYLKRKGYRILARNYMTAAGEADIVCVRGEQLVFVEVKTRSSDAFSRPVYAVDARKRKRYVAIAKQFVGKYRLFDYYVRFDIIEIVAGKIDHIENAFSGLEQ